MVALNAAILPAVLVSKIMDHIAAQIYHILNDGLPVVQATILSHFGSTPRISGTRMLIKTDGSIYGTIGGGVVEASVIRTASGMFAQGGYRIETFDLISNRYRDSLDMICGGHMEVLLDVITPTQANATLYRHMNNALDSGKTYMIITAMASDAMNRHELERCLIDDCGQLTGECSLTAAALDDIRKKASHTRLLTDLMYNGRRFIIEPLWCNGTLYIFGAGHIAVEVARLAASIDFRTFVFDDREEFANRKRFEHADDIIVLEDFSQVFRGFKITGDSYIVIVTRGHSHDKTVLSQVLKTDAGYIGMIGSRTKRDAIFNQLLVEGFCDDDLKRVFSPIGLNIGAQTPAEIAVSIIAELIQERAAKMGTLRLV